MDLQDIPGIREYGVTREGDVYNKRLEQRMSVRNNGRNTLITMLSLPKGRKTYVVGRLILHAFGEQPPSDTWAPYHKSHDYKNCKLDNLCWRPLGFRRERNRELRNGANLKGNFRINETGEVFHNTSDIADHIGGLEFYVRYFINYSDGYGHFGYTFTEV